LDYLPKMQGAGAIVRRVYSILSAVDNRPQKSASRAAAESLISEQLRFFSEDTSSPLHQGRGADVVPEAATDSADEEEGPDIDLRRLASSIASFGQRDRQSLQHPKD
jgi:hypothetical protein